MSEKKYIIAETGDYERLVPFFIENDLEFPEEDDIQTPTDLVRCWKVTEREEPDEGSKEYESRKSRLIGGFVLAKREDEFIVDGIAVDEDYRKSHIGRELLDKGIEETIKRGGKRIFLVARAPGFFKKAGFVTVPREEAPNFFECLTCPQYGVDCYPEVMRLDLDKDI